MRTRLFVAIVILTSLTVHSQTTNPGMDAPKLFDKGMNALTGSSATQSTANALEYFHRSAEQGYAPAQDVLGYFYETGIATPAEPAQAAEWYKKAALQDDSLAQWRLGQLIFAGAFPPRDLNDASDWLQKSAGHENAFAEYVLGMIKLERNDYPKAAEWFRKSAEQGLPQAQQQLALLLKRGQGVNVDKFEAYVWLLVSADAGNRSSANDLQALEADLGSNQVEQAKTKARQVERTANRSITSHGCTGWPGEFDTNPPPPPPDLQRFCR
jgi:TPR repeat protein